MPKIYVGNAQGKAKRAKNVYIGVDGVARTCRRVYVGDEDGIARLVFEKFYVTFRLYGGYRETFDVYYNNVRIGATPELLTQDGYNGYYTDYVVEGTGESATVEFKSTYQGGDMGYKRMTKTISHEDQGQTFTLYAYELTNNTYIPMYYYGAVLNRNISLLSYGRSMSTYIEALSLTSDERRYPDESIDVSKSAFTFKTDGRMNYFYAEVTPKEVKTQDSRVTLYLDGVDSNGDHINGTGKVFLRADNNVKTYVRKNGRHQEYWPADNTYFIYAQRSEDTSGAANIQIHSFYLVRES